MPRMIDPPEGWRYGFPKPLPDGTDENDILERLNEWLVENGYPQRMIDSLNGRVPCRFYTTNGTPSESPSP